MTRCATASERAETSRISRPAFTDPAEQLNWLTTGAAPLLPEQEGPFSGDPIGRICRAGACRCNGTYPWALSHSVLLCVARQRGNWLANSPSLVTAPERTETAGAL